MRTHEDSLCSVHPSTSTSPAAPRLTDQALVAVHLALSLAAPGPGPNVAHLVAGLAGAPEGLAGSLLRLQSGDVGPRIALHPSVAAASVPSLATAYIALPVLDRPCWTLELLRAARWVGGEDLDFLLQDCGVDLGSYSDDIGHHMPGPIEVGEALDAPETYGRLSLLDAGFSQDADLAVARARAHGGDSRDLLAWVGADGATRAALAGAPAVSVDAVVARASLGGGLTMPIGGTDLVTAITHLSLRAALDRS